MFVPYKYHSNTVLNIMPLSWCCHGIMVLSWCYHGSAVLPSWFSHGAIMVLPWCYYANQVSMAALMKLGLYRDASKSTFHADDVDAVGDGKPVCNGS